MLILLLDGWCVGCYVVVLLLVVSVGLFLWVGLDVNSVGHDGFGGLRLLVVYSLLLVAAKCLLMVVRFSLMAICWFGCGAFWLRFG